MTIQTWRQSPDAIIEQIDVIMEELAGLRQAVQDVLKSGKTTSVISDTSPGDPVDVEVQAYAAMHPSLWERFPTQYVAVYQGQLVDHDADALALSRRVHMRWPKEFVLIRKVEAKPDRELRIRSPRFVKEQQ
jgi:hypothetical protein